MSLLWSALIGLIVGAVAKLLIPGPQGGGIIATMLLGIVGSFVATFLGQAMGLYREGEPAGFIASVLGAILVVWLWAKLRGRKD